MKQTLLLALLLCTVTGSYAQGHESRYQRKIRALQKKGDRIDERQSQIQQSRFAEANKIYQYPVDSATDKIAFHRTIELPGVSNEEIFRRLKKFITLEQWTRTESIRAKDNTYVSAQLFDDPIVYEDPEAGEITFNGYFPLPYVKLHHCLLRFQYKAKIEDGRLDCQLSDFEAVEFLGAPKTKSRGGSSAFVYGATAFGSGRSTSTFSDKAIRIVPLERFMLNPDYAISSDAAFYDGCKAMLKRLKDAIQE